MRRGTSRAASARSAHAPVDQEESVDRNRSRDLGYRALERHDREQALIQQLDWPVPIRGVEQPKVELRSGARLTRHDPAPGSPVAGRGD